LSRVFLSNSGAESVDADLTSRKPQGKTDIIDMVKHSTEKQWELSARGNKK
jgi:acetylornithine/succinyldiaminopimelate/putrescine aminotransferase